MTLASKRVVRVAIPLLFQCTFVLVVVHLQRVTAVERRAAHTKGVIAQAVEMHAAAADAHAGVRGSAIAQDLRCSREIASSRLPPKSSRTSGVLFGEHDAVLNNARGVQLSGPRLL